MYTSKGSYILDTRKQQVEILTLEATIQNNTRDLQCTPKTGLLWVCIDDDYIGCALHSKLIQHGELCQAL